MSTPTTKDPQLDHLFNKLGFNRIEAVTTNTCSMCGKSCPESSFRDLLSLREFKISGACQSCQDTIYN